MKILFLKLCFAVFLTGGISGPVFAQTKAVEIGDNHFKNGKEWFDSLRYAEAKKEFNEARVAYSIALGLTQMFCGDTLDISIQIDECNKMMKECDKKINRQQLESPVDSNKSIRVSPGEIMFWAGKGIQLISDSLGNRVCRCGSG